MKIEPFRLERYFAEHEFAAEHLLSSSDCEALSLAWLLELADDETGRLWNSMRLGYTETAGSPLLREEVSRLYAGIGPDCILVAAPEEAIFIALNCLLEAGDHVVCTFPGYQSLYEIPAALGSEVEMWRPEEEEGWRFDVGSLEAMVRPETRAIVVNFPHNPTGHLPTARDFRRVVEIASGTGAYLLSDEMYRFLELDPAGRLPPACELYDRAISLSGMSKAFGMAGARIGWLATTDREAYRKMAAFKDYTTICSSAPSEILSLIALRARETILERNLATIAANLVALDGFFARRSRLFDWVRPRAGTTCFPRMLFDRDAAEFCGEVTARSGVMLLPSNVFGVEGHVRIGTGRTGMPEALERFERFLEEYGP